MKKDQIRKKQKEAEVFSREVHEGQLDDCGLPYFEAHIVPVVNAIKNFTNDEDVICAAYLHDTIEDTEVTYGEIFELFGEHVANLVMELTQEGCKDEYGFYFPRLKSQDAILIKLIDRASNISRMQNWTEERKSHYLKKTKFWKDGSDLK